MINNKMISIAEDFSDVPYGRYKSDGDYSGEVFRDTILVPALDKYETLTINIDGTEGYGSSFLDEAFAGLIRKGIIEKSDFNRRIEITAHDPASETYRLQIASYVREAKKD